MDRAWGYAPEAGAGVWVGLTDTGVDFQPDFTWLFATNQSAGRQIHRETTQDHLTPQCSHGTRLGGIIAAPRDGANVQGVAWKANLHSVLFTDYVIEVEGVDAFQALRKAGNWGDRIIAMAWSIAWNRDAISDEIDAAGSSPDAWWDPFPNSNVVFPAEKANVLAVSAANYYGGRYPEAHDRSQLDVVAYVPIETVGEYWSLRSTVTSSSAATGFLAGDRSPTTAFGGPTHTSPRAPPAGARRGRSAALVWLL